MANSKVITYAIELYFNKELETKITKIRDELVASMNGPEHRLCRYLSMSKIETTSRPCITLFTSTNPGSSTNYTLLVKLLTSLKEFFTENKCMLHDLPVALNLKDLIDLGNVDYMYVAPIDGLYDVRIFKKMLCEEMKLHGVDIDKDSETWRPVVKVVKQHWAQWSVRKAHEEKSWEFFCKENPLGLLGSVVEVGLVQVSPKRVLLQSYNLKGQEDNELVYDMKYFQKLGVVNDIDNANDVEEEEEEEINVKPKIYIGNRCISDEGVEGNNVKPVRAKKVLPKIYFGNRCIELAAA